MSSDSNYYNEIIDKLEKLTKREYAFIASLGIQAALLITVTLFTTFAFFEMLGHFSSAVRSIIFFTFLLFTIGSFSAFFFVPLIKYFNIFRRTNYFEVAKQVGKGFPAIKDDLLNAMQLAANKSKIVTYSPVLADAAFKQIYLRTKSIQFESLINFKKTKEFLFYFSGVVISCVLLLLFVPGLNAASFRLINFNQQFIPPQKFVFQIQPGNAQLTKGDNISITVKVTGTLPKEVYIATKTNEQTDYEKQLLTANSPGSYNFELKSVRNSFKYYVFAEDIKSDVYEILVTDRPIIKMLGVTVQPPAYSKIPSFEQKDNGNVSALTGSKIELEILSTKNLKEARIDFTDSTSVKMTVNNNAAKGEFKIKGDNNYKIIIKDENNNENLSPITYTVKALLDDYPSIVLVSPNQNVSLPNDNRLPLSLKIQDDYGFTKLLLRYRLSASKYETLQNESKFIEIPINKNQKEADISYIWNLTPLSLATEDVVTYYLEIFDNDNVSGPKSTKSSSFTVRIPTLDEILTKADDHQNKAQDELKQTLKEADELKQTLEKIDQDLKQDKKELTWQEKDKIEKALDKFEKLQNKIGDMKNELEKMKQDLQQNNLLSKETLEKYMELQKLLNEMTSEEMKKAMDKMRETLQSLNRQLTQEQMQNIKIDEDRFQKSIERTMNLLKRIQVEQKIDELLKRTGNLKKDQDELKNDVNNNNKDNQQERQQLSEKQNDLTKDMDKLKQEMNELSKKMDELKDLPKDQLDKAREEYEKQNNQQLSQKASQNIQQNQMQQAQQKQGKISQNMQQMNKMMQQLQQSVQQQNQVQTFTDMMHIMDNLITLSKQQEALKSELENMDANTTFLNENAQKQNSIQNNLDKVVQQMAELSQKTFAITPEMGKSLGDARHEMMKAIEALQGRNGNQASKSQGESMKSLNEAAAMMKNSMEAMMQGGGQGGMMSLMQQLKNMAGQQMGLNNMTQMLQQAQQGKLTMEQQAQLQKLMQQQELIKKSMQQLNNEAKLSGRSKALPANLDDIVKKMHEVISDMKTDKLDDNLVQKQERILSKLLDAQRSVNERDFEKRREADTGKNIVRQSPAELNLSTEKGRNKIKDELNKAVQEGYSKDYEELIRKYFEALQKEGTKN